MISKVITVASSSIANVKTYNSQKASLALSFLSIKSLFFFSIILLVSVLENALPLRENTLECTSCQATIQPMVTGSLVLQWGSVSRLASLEACFLVASQDSGTFVSSLRESLSARGGLVHSYPTSEMPNRPKWQIINFHWETELTRRFFKPPVSRLACPLFNMEIYLRCQIKIRMLPSG